jgi:hypothetical protein
MTKHLERRAVVEEKARQGRQNKVPGAISGEKIPSYISMQRRGGAEI